MCLRPEHDEVPRLGQAMVLGPRACGQHALEHVVGHSIGLVARDHDLDRPASRRNAS
jgi:hypothetical protein